MDTLHHDFRFGRCTLRPVQRQLLVDGLPVKVGARAFDVLLALVEQRQRIVSKSELIDRVWPEVVVEENNLEVHIWALRKLIGAQAIVTVPGRGYRFALPLDDEGTGTAPTAGSPTRAPAPQRLPPLIGRDRELLALRHDLDEHALVTVTGVGGIGKSLLAQHLLALERDRRPHGASWADLAALTEPAQVAATVAGALGLPLGGGELRRALAAAASPLKLLLVLDNAEHLVAEVASLAQALLDAAPALHILVTSQLPLQLAGERVHRLGPLATPAGPVAADEAMTFGAVALFVERVQALQRRFELDGANVAAVCSLCRRLDGSALAIELAAARVPLLGVHRLEQTLDERLDLLTKSRRHAPARQHSLRAALEWTEALLGADERLAFGRLAVFCGGFTLELAQQVAADAELDRWRLLAALDTLVDRSLVAVLDGEPMRYRMLESPLALARERLAASGELQTLQARHAAAVHERFLAVNVDCNEGRIQREQMLELLGPELDNGRAAMAWALRHDTAMAIGLVTPLTNALGRLRNLEGRPLWEATATLVDESLPASLRLAWSIGAALFHYTERENDRACSHARTAAALARALGEPRRLAQALGLLAARDGSLDGEQRRAAIEEMLALTPPQAPLLHHVNNAQAEFVWAHSVGDLDRCEAAGRRWLELTRGPGWAYERGVALNNVADLALARGQPQLAAQMGRELELQLRDSRQIRNLAIVRVNLLTALLACDDLAGARDIAARAWPMAAPWRLQPYCGVALSLLAALEGRLRAAAALHGYAQARLVAAGIEVETNEANALRRAEALARAALGDATFAALQRTGESWPDARAGDAALAAADID